MKQFEFLWKKQSAPGLSAAETFTVTAEIELEGYMAQME